MMLLGDILMVDIYINDGTHGCINAPKYLAKKIFAEIEAGTPVICYEEK